MLVQFHILICISKEKHLIETENEYRWDQRNTGLNTVIKKLKTHSKDLYLKCKIYLKSSNSDICAYKLAEKYKNKNSHLAESIEKQNHSK